MSASSLLIASELYLPLIVTVVLLVVAIGMRHDGESTIRIKPFGAALDVSLPVKNRLLAMMTTVSMAVALLGTYCFYDYASFFPKRLDLDVFYDGPGLTRAVADVVGDDADRYGIIEDFDVARRAYYQEMDLIVAKIIGLSDFYSTADSGLHSSGQTTFIVRSVGGSIQKYYIAEASGDITTTLDVPGRQMTRLYTKFTKMNSSYDYLSPTLWDIFVRHSIVMLPHFKQLLATDDSGSSETFRSEVVGVTKVAIFPWPTISDTIYCIRSGGTRLLPVAYGVYR